MLCLLLIAASPTFTVPPNFEAARDFAPLVFLALLLNYYSFVDLLFDTAEPFPETLSTDFF